MTNRAAVPVHVRDLKAEWLRLAGEAARAQNAADEARQAATNARRQYLQASRDEAEGRALEIVQRRQHREAEERRRVAEIIERGEREQLERRVATMQPEPETQRQARTQCVNGHELTAENTYEREDGKRRCRQCQLERSRRYRQDCKEILGR